MSPGAQFAGLPSTVIVVGEREGDGGGGADGEDDVVAILSQHASAGEEDRVADLPEPSPHRPSLTTGMATRVDFSAPNTPAVAVKHLHPSAAQAASSLVMPAGHPVLIRRGTSTEDDSIEIIAMPSPTARMPVVLDE
jgi:hypothetical protein